MHDFNPPATPVGFLYSLFFILCADVREHQGTPLQLIGRLSVNNIALI